MTITSTSTWSEAPNTAVSVLVVEDAPEFLQLIETTLSKDGYEITTATDGTTALQLARTNEPDVIVLDLGLPGMDGVEVCRQLRTFTDAYIIMVTARDEEVDRLVGLAVGADDYLTKPFSVRELAARVQVLLRRPRATAITPAAEPQLPEGVRVVADLEISTLAREVRVGGVEAQLTKIEFDMLETLSRRPEMVFTRQMLIDNVWGDDWVGDGHIVDVHMANLRKKIDTGDLRHIKTIRGVGYRMNID